MKNSTIDIDSILKTGTVNDDMNNINCFGNIKSYIDKAAITKFGTNTFNGPVYNNCTFNKH